MRAQNLTSVPEPSLMVKKRKSGLYFCTQGIKNLDSCSTIAESADFVYNIECNIVTLFQTQQ